MMQASRPQDRQFLEGFDDPRGPRMCPKGSGYHGNDGECVRMHICRRFWLAVLLPWEALRGPLCCRHQCRSLRL